MLGAGIVLLIFGILALLLARSLGRSGSDVFALAGMIPAAAGFGLLVLALIFILIGLGS